MKPCGTETPTTTAAATLFSFLRQSGNNCDSKQLMKDLATREFNAFLWISLIAITALLLRKVVKLFRLWVQARNIPGPPCPSFYGHSNLISRENLIDVLSVAHKKYGSVVRLWLGPTQLLVSIKDPALIKDMLLKAEDKLPLTGRAFRLAFGPSSLFVSSFGEVQKRRESLATELNGKLIERATVIPTKVVDCIMDRIHKMMDEGSIDCRVVSQHMAFTLLGATLFGDAFLVWSKATIYEELLMMIAKDACFWASYTVTPVWKQGFWRYQRLCTKLKCLTQDIVQQCRKNYKLFRHGDENLHNETANMGMGSASGAPSCSGVEMPANCFLHELNGHLNAREEPCGNIMGVMFHGCLTTAGSDWLGLNLVLAWAEMHMRSLEPGRVYNTFYLTLYFNLKTGVTIPAGAVLVVPVHLVQMDDSSWGTNASEFNPYRFLTKSGNGSDLVLNSSPTGVAEELVSPGESKFVLNDPNDNVAFLPFGSGTRACVGQKFVIQGVVTLFASLLEQYEIRLQSGSQSDSIPATNHGVFQPLPSPKIVFVRRND
uniref:Uncharacterized protein n=1 Tax=Fagus sylvatica TaxID=28930 RepID=A0A2N9GUD8_FAGSY